MAEVLREVQELTRRVHKSLECAICLEILVEPYSTQCNHQFCRKCLDQLLSKRKRKSDVLCPLCKTKISKRGLTENLKLGGIVNAVRSVLDAIDEDFSAVRGNNDVEHKLQNKNSQKNSSQEDVEEQTIGDKRKTISNLEKPIKSKVKTRWVNQKKTVKPKNNEETTNNEVPLNNETAELLEAFESASLGRRKRQSKNACDRSLSKSSDDGILVKDQKESDAVITKAAKDHDNDTRKEQCVGSETTTKSKKEGNSLRKYNHAQKHPIVNIGVEEDLGTEEPDLYVPGPADLAVTNPEKVSDTEALKSKNGSEEQTNTVYVVAETPLLPVPVDEEGEHPKQALKLLHTKGSNFEDEERKRRKVSPFANIDSKKDFQLQNPVSKCFDFDEDDSKDLYERIKSRSRKVDIKGKENKVRREVVENRSKRAVKKKEKIELVNEHVVEGLEKEIRSGRTTGSKSKRRLRGKAIDKSSRIVDSSIAASSQVIDSDSTQNSNIKDTSKEGNVSEGNNETKYMTPDDNDAQDNNKTKQVDNSIATIDLVSPVATQADVTKLSQESIVYNIDKNIHVKEGTKKIEPQSVCSRSSLEMKEIDIVPASVSSSNESCNNVINPMAHMKIDSSTSKCIDKKMESIDENMESESEKHDTLLSTENHREDKNKLHDDKDTGADELCSDVKQRKGDEGEAIDDQINRSVNAVDTAEPDVVEDKEGTPTSGTEVDLTSRNPLNAQDNNLDNLKENVNESNKDVINCSGSVDLFCSRSATANFTENTQFGTQSSSGNTRSNERRVASSSSQLSQGSVSLLEEKNERPKVVNEEHKTPVPEKTHESDMESDHDIEVDDKKDADDVTGTESRKELSKIESQLNEVESDDNSGQLSEVTKKDEQQKDQAGIEPIELSKVISKEKGPKDEVKLDKEDIESEEQISEPYNDRPQMAEAKAMIGNVNYLDVTKSYSDNNNVISGIFSNAAFRPFPNVCDNLLPAEGDCTFCAGCRRKMQQKPLEMLALVQNTLNVAKHEYAEFHVKKRHTIGNLSSPAAARHDKRKVKSLDVNKVSATIGSRKDFLSKKSDEFIKVCRSDYPFEEIEMGDGEEKGIVERYSDDDNKQFSIKRRRSKRGKRKGKAPRKAPGKVTSREVEEKELDKKASLNSSFDLFEESGKEMPESSSKVSEGPKESISPNREEGSVLDNLLCENSENNDPASSKHTSCYDEGVYSSAILEDTGKPDTDLNGTGCPEDLEKKVKLKDVVPFASCDLGSNIEVIPPTPPERTAKQVNRSVINRNKVLETEVGGHPASTKNNEDSESLMVKNDSNVDNNNAGNSTEVRGETLTSISEKTLPESNVKRGLSLAKRKRNQDKLELNAESNKCKENYGKDNVAGNGETCLKESTTSLILVDDHCSERNENVVETTGKEQTKPVDDNHRTGISSLNSKKRKKDEMIGMLAKRTKISGGEEEPSNKSFQIIERVVDLSTQPEDQGMFYSLDSVANSDLHIEDGADAVVCDASKDNDADADGISGIVDYDDDIVLFEDNEEDDFREEDIEEEKPLNKVTFGDERGKALETVGDEFGEFRIDNDDPAFSVKEAKKEEKDNKELAEIDEEDVSGLAEIKEVTISESPEMQEDEIDYFAEIKQAEIVELAEIQEKEIDEFGEIREKDVIELENGYSEPNVEGDRANGLSEQATDRKKALKGGTNVDAYTEGRGRYKENNISGKGWLGKKDNSARKNDLVSSANEKDIFASSDSAFEREIAKESFVDMEKLIATETKTPVAKSVPSFKSLVAKMSKIDADDSILETYGSDEDCDVLLKPSFDIRKDTLNSKTERTKEKDLQTCISGIKSTTAGMKSYRKFEETELEYLSPPSPTPPPKVKRRKTSPPELDSFLDEMKKLLHEDDNNDEDMILLDNNDGILSYRKISTGNEAANRKTSAGNEATNRKISTGNEATNRKISAGNEATSRKLSAGNGATITKTRLKDDAAVVRERLNAKQSIDITDGKSRGTAIGNSVTAKEPITVEKVTKPTKDVMVDLTSSQTQLAIDSPKKAPLVEKEVLKTPIINSDLRRKNMQKQIDNVGNDQNMDAKGKELTIIPSRLKRKEMSYCKAMTDRMDCKFSSTYIPGSTHLVMGTDENLAIDRTGYTYKYLMALITGNWIVSFKWIIACLKAGKLVSEENFEVKGDPSANQQMIPKIARIAKMKKEAPLFNQLSLSLLGDLKGSQISKEQLTQMLKICGAKVMFEMPKEIPEKNYLLITDKESLENGLASRCLESNIQPVNYDWIMESIINYKVQDPTPFLFNL